MLFVSFEPSVDAAAEVSTSSLFSVGETLFSPLRSQDVTPYIGGVTKVVVTNGGSCTDSSGSSTSIHGQLPVIFTGASGVTANAYINSGVVESVHLDSYSSTQIPLTTAITATIGQDAQGMPGVSCNGVELEVVNGGLSYFAVNRQGQGYTSAPEVTLSGGAGDNRFEPAQVYAVANDVNQPNNFEVWFRTVCATRQGTGGTSDQCMCSEASGGFYSSVPTVTFSGGLADYISFSGLGSASSDLASSSLMPRAGTVQADQASLLPYLSAMLPIPAAVTLSTLALSIATFRCGIKSSIFRRPDLSVNFAPHRQPRRRSAYLGMRRWGCAATQLIHAGGRWRTRSAVSARRMVLGPLGVLCLQPPRALPTMAKLRQRFCTISSTKFFWHILMGPFPAEVVVAVVVRTLMAVVELA